MEAEQEQPGEDGEGRGQDRAGLADERFAANVREHRERAGMSLKAAAGKMAALGYPFYPQTLNRIESGTRKVSVGEAVALAALYGTTVDRLTWPGQEASAAALLADFTARARLAYEQVAESAATLEHARAQLALTVSEAEAAGCFGSKKIRELAQDAREAMTLSAGGAVRAGIREYQEMIQGVRDERD